MNTYNTQKNKLIIREYGRNTQKMIAYVKTIEDKEKRQIHIERIINLIMSMYPDTRNVEDYRLKVWSHVLKMANYELDVDIPENIPSTKERKVPEKVAYPNLTRRYRHYGMHVRSMIAKAKKMEDLEKQANYIVIIGSYMKMVYKEHNRENVNDQVIFEEFKALANGELEIPKGANINIYATQRKSNYASNNRRDKNSKHTNQNRRNNSSASSKKNNNNQTRRKKR